jgi:hypothetical protein
MKRRMVIASAVAALALALSSRARAADGPPPGRYTAKITSPAALKGMWSLTWVKNGTYTITRNGKVVVKGHDLSIGRQMQLYKETGPLACKAIGFYNFKRTGKSLTFSKLSDSSCAGRSLVLSHAFKLAA